MNACVYHSTYNLALPCLNIPLPARVYVCAVHVCVYVYTC